MICSLAKITIRHPTPLVCWALFFGGEDPKLTELVEVAKHETMVFPCRTEDSWKRPLQIQVVPNSRKIVPGKQPSKFTEKQRKTRPHLQGNLWGTYGHLATEQGTAPVASAWLQQSVRLPNAPRLSTRSSQWNKWFSKRIRWGSQGKLLAAPSKVIWGHLWQIYGHHWSSMFEFLYRYRWWRLVKCTGHHEAFAISV